MPQTRNVDIDENATVKITADENDQDDDEIINTKLRRKPAVKLRRHPTEDGSEMMSDEAIRGHVRSVSYQDIANLGTGGADDGPERDGCTLEHGDSGIVINVERCDGGPSDGPSATTTTSTTDGPRRVFSVDESPAGRRRRRQQQQQRQQSPMAGHAYVYSDQRKMPLLNEPTPPSPPRPSSSSSSSQAHAELGAGSPSADGVIVLPEPGESSSDHAEPINGSDLIVTYRTGRDGGGPIIRKAKTDPGHDRPYPFTRKHSMPAIYAPRSLSQKVNLGNVECFQIHFNIIEELTKETDIELVPAIRGVTLREAVNSYLCKRGLSFEMVDFFIAASQSPLQVDTADCYFLAGADLHVRAKQTVNSPYTRSTSTVSNRSGLKAGKNSRSEANLPETVSPHGTLRGNQPLKGITKIFANTKKSDQLNEILHLYSQNGLPPIPGLLQIGHKKFDPAIFRLEDSWTDIVKDPQNCNRYQQEAIWELLKTEVAYIRDLQLVISLFLACLYDLQSHEILNDVETEKIFSNIADLHQHNCLFYETHMYKIVTMARETGQPLDPAPLIHGFTEFRSFFEAYSRFCIDYMSCQQYLIRMKEENELFRIFLSWAENQRECNRLSLRDYIGKPFQRLTKYKLLLERIWREPRPDNVQAMISKVDQFICQVNATVTQLEIMRRIDSYDAVDLPNNDAVAKMVGPFSRLDLTLPIPGTNRTRFLLEEGTLRMNNRTEVICFLFTDMLLITKATSKKVDVGSKVRVKVYKPPMRLDKVFISQLNDGGFMLIYMNEYNLATTAYTFHGDQSRLWFDRLRQAQADYEKLHKALMDQSEAQLLHWANGADFEQESAYVNARAAAARDVGLVKRSAGVHRHTSSSSSDVTAVFSDGPRSEGRRPYSIPGSEVDKLRIRSVVGRQDENADGGRRGSPPVGPLMVDRHANGSGGPSGHQQQLRYAHRDQQPTRPDAGAGFGHPYPARRAPTGGERHGQQAQQPGTPPPAPDDGRRLPATTASQDNLRKLKQRRDRRYYTADMVQDLRHGKDASIQKRLSWHSGAKDTDYECRQRTLRCGGGAGGGGAMASADSLRSVCSSSGISSVGSLHQGHEEEISEEGSIHQGHGEDIGEDGSLHRGHDDEDDVGSPHRRHDRDIGEESSVEWPERTGDYSSPIAGDRPSAETNLARQSSVSKSMPDISRLTLLEAGAGSRTQRAALAELLQEGQRRKLSDSHGKRLKLQLLNSTLEATDV